jgi:hypothetical protein
MRSLFCHKLLPVLPLLLITAACGLPFDQTVEPVLTLTSTPSLAMTVTSSHTSTLTPTLKLTITPTDTRTFTPIPSRTPTITPVPTNTSTPTITTTPTFDFPDVTVRMQAHCRYGPSTGYLHAADLYAGDVGTVRGRNNSGTWLYVKFDELDYFCWAAASVLDVQGDVFTVYVTERKLPQSTLYGPPENVQAVREGDKVTVTWDRVNMTEDDDRGYMIEAFICQDGGYIFVVVATDNTSYEFNDVAGCAQPSSGLLYTVEKHGYTDPVSIPWPEP